MQQLTKQIMLLERIDQLVRLHATGTPTEFAARLGISKAKLYRTIDVMKELRAPIVYNISLRSFKYEEAVNFKFGFYLKILPQQDAANISGGIAVMELTLQFFIYPYPKFG